MICKPAVRASALCLAALAGCASDYSIEDPRFGEAVRYTVALQTADPARYGPRLDGEKGEAALRNYREFKKIDPPPAPVFGSPSDN